jgi:hypothetical protein
MTYPYAKDTFANSVGPPYLNATYFNKLEAGVYAANAFVNVKDYGAVGDNSTDDYAAIQAAINAVPTVSWRNSNIRAGVVFFPPGSYVCRTALTLPQTYTADSAYQTHITLQGSGWRASQIRRQNADNNILVDASGTITAGNVVTRVIGFQMRDIGLNGADGTNPLLRQYYHMTGFIERCYFQSNNGPAIEGVEYQDSSIVRCWFDYCGGATDSNTAGTATGKESVRILSWADNAVSGTFGYSTDNSNAIWFEGNHFTGLNTDNRGQVVISSNGSGNQAHRCTFINNKIEQQEMGGNQVKLFNCNNIHFQNQEFTGYTVHAGASPISFLEAVNADSVSVRGCYFADEGAASVTHAAIKATNCDNWTIEDIRTNFGTAAGTDTNAAVIADLTGGGNTNWYLNNHSISGRTTPKFSGSLPSNFFGPVRGALSTSTPGAVATVVIAHGLGYTPTAISMEPADANARGAPTYYVTADDTNLTLNFSSNLTAATAYSWRWMAS